MYSYKRQSENQITSHLFQKCERGANQIYKSKGWKPKRAETNDKETKIQERKSTKLKISSFKRVKLMNARQD